MSLDDRLKDEMTRRARLVAPDVRRDLRIVRRMTRRATIIRRTTGALLVVALVIGSVLLGPRMIDSMKDRGRTPATGVGVDGGWVPISLLGSWTQKRSCRAIVRVLTRYGLERYIAPNLKKAFQDRPRRVIAAMSDPCKGAGPPQQRTWTFRGDRLYGYLDGEQVDLAFPEPLDDQTVRISHIDIGFRTDGNTLHFIVPPLPRSCTGRDCLSQHAWAVVALGVGPWTRS